MSGQAEKRTIHQEVADCLHERGRTQLPAVLRVQQLLSEIARNPGTKLLFQRRVENVEMVIGVVNKTLSSPEISADFTNIQALRSAFPGQTLPRILEVYTALQGYAAMHPGERVRSKAPVATMIGSVSETFDDIHKKALSGEWEFVRAERSDDRLISGLLLEGYGLFMEKFTGIEGIGRTTVLALEEQLVTTYRTSDVLKAVLPWMIEERQDFGGSIRRFLDIKAAQQGQKPGHLK